MTVPGELPATQATTFEELDPWRQEMGTFLVSHFELEHVREETIVMYGLSGSVVFGLGRCAEHLLNADPDLQHDTILELVAKQKAAEAAKASE